MLYKKHRVLYRNDNEECLGHLYLSDADKQTLCLEYNNADCSVEAISFTMDDGQSSGLASMINRKKHFRLPDLAWKVEGGVDRTKDNDGNRGLRADVTYENETKGGTQYEVKSYGEVSTNKEGETTETVGVRVGVNG